MSDDSELITDCRARGFSLGWLLYLSTLLAASLAAFGAWGVAVFALVASKHSKRFTLSELAVLVAIALLFYAMLLPTGWSDSSRRLTRRVSEADESLSCMREIAFAAKQSCREQGAYPGDFPTASGVRLSWRIHLLSKLEITPYIEDYGLDSCWDGQNADELEIDTPFSMTSRWRSSGHSCYYAIAGEGTAWSEGQARPDLDNSIYDSEDALLIEVDAGLAGTEWFESGDLSPEKVVEILSSPRDIGEAWRVLDYGLLWRPAEVRHLALSDGEVVRLHCLISRRLAEALVYTNVPMDWGLRREFESAQGKPIDYQVCVGWPVFTLVAAWPFFGASRTS